MRLSISVYCNGTERLAVLAAMMAVEAEGHAVIHTKAYCTF